MRDVSVNQWLEEEFWCWREPNGNIRMMSLVNLVLIGALKLLPIGIQINIRLCFIYSSFIVKLANHRVLSIDEGLGKVSK